MEIYKEGLYKGYRMEIGLTSNLQKKCGISKLPASTETDLFYCWDIAFEKLGSRNVLFIANASNRLACVVSGMKPSAYKDIAGYAVKYIKELMLLQGYSESEADEYIKKAGEPTLTKTHGKKAVGAMMNSFMAVSYSHFEVEPEKNLQDDMSLWINRFIGRCASRGDEYIHPYEAFKEDMEKAGIK